MNTEMKEALRKVLIRIGISGHYDLFVQSMVEKKPKVTLDEVKLLKEDKGCLLLIQGIRNYRWEGYKTAIGETLGEDVFDSLESPEDFIDMVYRIEQKEVKNNDTKSEDNKTSR